MGMVYREIKQAGDRHREMFNGCRGIRRSRCARRQTLIVTTGNVRFDDVRFSYDPERPNPEGSQFRSAGGKTVADVGPSGRGKSDHFAAAVSSL